MTAGPTSPAGRTLTPRPGPAVPGRVPVRLGPVSGVLRPRALAVPVVLAVLLVLALAVGTGRGEFPIPVTDVLAVLAGGGEESQRFVVLELRLPRALTGLLVGCALGMAGAIFQTVARNPLASPDVLGITAGAGAAAVGLIVLGGSGAVALPLAALAGGLGTALLVHGLAWRQGIEGFRLVLVGIGVGAVMTSATSYLLVRAEIEEATRATVWLTGSLNGRGWEHVVPVALAVGAAGLVALLSVPTLRALSLGEAPARGLGVHVQRGQTVLLLAAVVLASVATASAGPVAFVAFVAPQIALRLVRSPGPPLVAGALVGGLVVVGGDLVARTVLPVELPVGIVTAVLGAPYLLHLLVRRSREASA